MLFEHQKLKYLVIALILLLVLSACVRPLQPAEEEAEATAVSESTTEEESGETSSSEEPEDSAGDEQTSEQTDTESPDESIGEETETEEDVAEGEVPEESGSEESVDTAETEEETADSEVGGGTPDTPEEETVTEELPETEVTEEEEAVAEETEEEPDEVMTEEETTEEITEEETAEEMTEEATAEEETEADSQQQATSPTGEIIHVVAPGENLYRIGLQYGMSWVPIARYNNITNPNRIVVGQEIIIPGTTSQPPTATPTPPDGSSFTNYVVQPGDTLNSISRKFGVSSQEIAEANGLVNPNLIYAGQVLKIPTSTPETPPQVTHKVQRGETLYSISLIYGVHWLSIAQANNITSPYVIYAGQSLIIPGG
jgi:LysM repeat protein